LTGVGKVLQYKYYYTVDLDDTTTSSSWQNLGLLSVAITPKSTTSKLIIKMSGTAFAQQGWSGVDVRVYDVTNSTAYQHSQVFRLDMQSDRNQYMYARAAITDSLVIASGSLVARTYRMEFRSASGGGQSAGFNVGSALFEITEVEV
jgi:hypothetical protein